MERRVALLFAEASFFQQADIPLGNTVQAGSFKAAEEPH